MSKMNIKTQSQNSYLSMAPISYFLLILTLSSTIHARESQFFNKFSNNNQQQPLNTNQEQPLNTNQQQQQPLNTNQQEQPEFIPQTQDSDSYGLYGHESGQLPPSATTTTTTNNNNNNLPDYLPENYNPVAYTTPIHSNTQEEYIPDEYKEYPQANKYNGESRMYNSGKQGFDFEDARFMETRDGGGNMYNSEKQVEDQRYNSEMQGMGRYGTRGNGNMYNPEKQGMSDTRFLENGKYYYDINMENPNSNPNMNMDMNTRGFGSRHGYSTQGYYGNNQNSYGSRNGYNTQGYYGNNQNSYDRYNYNYNGGYQNQEYRFNP